MDEEASIPQPPGQASSGGPATGGAALRTAVAAYTAALTAAFAPCRAAGARQADLAAALHIHPGTMSRYFTGQRILHHNLLPAFADHLAALGHPLTGPQQRELELLERNVRRHRSPDGMRIAELEDERDTLQTDLSAVQESLHRALADVEDRDQKLAGWLKKAEGDADRLRRSLAEQDAMIATLRSRLTEADEARRDAEEQAAAEAARADELAGRLSDADTQLAAAVRLVGDADRDAARAQERATALGAEIEVLRRQVRALLKEPFLAPDAFTPPPSADEEATGRNAAELVTAQLQPPVAGQAITPTPLPPAPPSVPAPRPAPAPYRRMPQPARPAKRRWRPALRDLPRPGVARAVGMVFSLLLLAGAVAAFAAAHIQQFAYTRAALCTEDQISRGDSSGCLTQQAGTVTDRASETHDDTTSYSVTVTTPSGKPETWDVDQSFHDGTPPHTPVTIHTYNGTIVTLTHGTLTADVADASAFLSWKQLATPLALMTAAALPLIVSADRFFISIKLIGLVPIATIWNAVLLGLTFNGWRPESWTSTTTAVVHALAWVLTCLPPLAMAALD
ncbi:hypothetical protein [Streptomyces sp. NPDC004266]|uniref:hypothetical protein n=1 Tax=Streptomyces sp. NPDC004266 TaxID=3364693 RepID=UPI0036BE1AB3